MRRITLVLTALVLASGCSTDLGSGLQTEFDGVRYSATVEDIIADNDDPLNRPVARQFAVNVTAENRTGVAKTRTYPAICPVRVRLYRASDDALLYDETRKDCAPAPEGTLTIEPFGTKPLTSGIRFPATIAGDSLATASTIYNVHAVVMTEGSKFVEINAGTTHLRSSCPRAALPSC
jgi:hypothetical protein